MTTTETCPVCLEHPAVRGLTYGIDTFVCDAVPSMGLVFAAADFFPAVREDLARINRERLLVDRAPSIYERHYPLGATPQFTIIDEAQDWNSRAMWAHIDELMLKELESWRRFIGWTADAPAFEEPKPSEDPDPALGEGAVSPTRHLRNWKNRACTPSSLRSPST